MINLVKTDNTQNYQTRNKGMKGSFFGQKMTATNR